jgi:hypothetical protein
MRMRIVVFGLALIAASGGCGDSDPEEARTASSASTAQTTTGSESSATTSITPDFPGGIDGPVMFAPGPPMEGGQDALIEGVLVRDGDCLFVGDRAPGTRYAILWPFGTAWDDDAQEVIAPDGTRIPLGSILSAGGGYRSPETLQRLLDANALAERANACAEGEFRELAHVQHSITVEAGPSTES